MAFAFQQKVLFRHCDPAGIVFYPRYFEIINDCVEAFFEAELGRTFQDIHKSGGVPTAEISAKFIAPSWHGDMLDINLDCSKIGNTSLMLEFEGSCKGVPRFTARSALVLVTSKGRPESWPDALRHRLENFMKGNN